MQVSQHRVSSTGLSPSLTALSRTFDYTTLPLPLRAAPLSLATTRGIFYVPQATEMFQFAHLPPTCLCVQQAVSRHHSGGVAPFGLSGLMACMQLPRNVSPVSASFFGLQRLGIHLVLCVACSLLLLGWLICYILLHAAWYHLACMVFALADQPPCEGWSCLID